MLLFSQARIEWVLDFLGHATCFVSIFEVIDVMGQTLGLQIQHSLGALDRSRSVSLISIVLSAIGT